MTFKRMSFEEVLDDLQSRFIINIPEEELKSVERICFQIEQAHWFYEDFVREENPKLPSYSLKNFSSRFFQYCPLLHEWAHDHETAFANFIEYKVRVPVCGAIILNTKMDKVLLVKGWKAGSGWGFPKGKINKDEPLTSCAVREVMEETGFDISAFLKESDYVERTMKEQRIRLYIITGIPENTVFETQTRKEIGDIKWHPLNSLSGWSKDPEGFQSDAIGSISKHKFYMVTAFVGAIKSWMAKHKQSKKSASRKALASKDYKSTSEWESDLDLSVAHYQVTSDVEVSKRATPVPKKPPPTTPLKPDQSGKSASKLVSRLDQEMLIQNATEIDVRGLKTPTKGGKGKGKPQPATTLQLQPDVRDIQPNGVSPVKTPGSGSNEAATNSLKALIGIGAAEALKPPLPPQQQHQQQQQPGTSAAQPEGISISVESLFSQRLDPFSFSALGSALPASAAPAPSTLPGTMPVAAPALPSVTSLPWPPQPAPSAGLPGAVAPPTLPMSTPDFGLAMPMPFLGGPPPLQISTEPQRQGWPVPAPPAPLESISSKPVPAPFNSHHKSELLTILTGNTDSTRPARPSHAGGSMMGIHTDGGIYPPAFPQPGMMLPPSADHTLIDPKLDLLSILTTKAPAPPLVQFPLANMPYAIPNEHLVINPSEPPAASVPAQWPAAVAPASFEAAGPPIPFRIAPPVQIPVGTGEQVPLAHPGTNASSITNLFSSPQSDAISSAGQVWNPPNRLQQHKSDLLSLLVGTGAPKPVEPPLSGHRNVSPTTPNKLHVHTTQTGTDFINLLTGGQPPVQSNQAYSSLYEQAPEASAPRHRALDLTQFTAPPSADSYSNRLQPAHTINSAGVVSQADPLTGTDLLSSFSTGGRLDSLDEPSADSELQKLEPSQVPVRRQSREFSTTTSSILRKKSSSASVKLRLETQTEPTPDPQPVDYLKALLGIASPTSEQPAAGLQLPQHAQRAASPTAGGKPNNQHLLAKKKHKEPQPILLESEEDEDEDEEMDYSTLESAGPSRRSSSSQSRIGTKPAARNSHRDKPSHRSSQTGSGKPRKRDKGPSASAPSAPPASNPTPQYRILQRGEVI